MENFRWSTGKNAQGALFSFSAHEFKKYLLSNFPDELHHYRSRSSDSHYQFWKREPMIKECWSYSFLAQKLDYIHHNPCQPRWNLSTSPEDYRWSSAAFYQNGDHYFQWLKHFEDE